MELRRVEVTARWREEEDLWEQILERYEGVTTDHSYTHTLDCRWRTTQKECTN